MTRLILAMVLEAGLTFFLPASTFAQADQMLVGLPIGPSKSGQGPWDVRIWPAKGCGDCQPDKEAFAAFIAWRDALSLGNFDESHPSSIVVHVVRLLSISQSESTISGADLYASIKDCKKAAQGTLPQQKEALGIQSFGVRLDCAVDEKPRFISITVNKHNLMSVYYLPDNPIWVLKRH